MGQDRRGQLCGFDLRGGTDLRPDADGVYRSRVFPGLWIDGAAVFADDLRRILKTVGRGTRTKAQAAFVRQLKAKVPKKKVKKEPPARHARGDAKRKRAGGK